MNRLLACAAFGVVAFVGLSAREQAATQEITVVGRDHAFSPNRIVVNRDSVVKITFNAADMAHGFAIDQYRIMKRASAGHSVTFEFRADQAGTFEFYCNLTADDRCRQMKGQLVVK
jgi:cytochrome c oxidase subunit II